MNDPIRPIHYTSKGIEPIKFINSHNLNFNLGNVVKYVVRRGSKDGEPELQDLQKARQYVDFEIARIKKVQKKETQNGVNSHPTEEEHSTGVSE